MPETETPYRSKCLHQGWGRTVEIRHVDIEGSSARRVPAVAAEGFLRLCVRAGDRERGSGAGPFWNDRDTDQLLPQARA